MTFCTKWNSRSLKAWLRSCRANTPVVAGRKLHRASTKTSKLALRARADTSCAPALASMKSTSTRMK
eukprot:scaffold2304_cov115-Pinguiococcus_pyrenoidosus.AAC.1